MAKLTRTRIPFIVALAYASIVACLFLLAIFTQDEFGFRFIPVIEATYPLSRVLYRNSDIFLSILVGGAVNTLLLYGFLKGTALLIASRVAK
jgi:hypothetical protein